MISPAIEAASKSSRTEADVRRERETRSRLMPIGRFYLVEERLSRGPTYFTETDNLPRGHDATPEEGLDALRQAGDPISIWECIPADGVMRDVSEDMAMLWFDAIAHDVRDESDLPTFIRAHLSDDELDEFFQDLKDWETAPQ